MYSAFRPEPRKLSRCESMCPVEFARFVPIARASVSPEGAPSTPVQFGLLMLVRWNEALQTSANAFVTTFFGIHNWPPTKQQRKCRSHVFTSDFDRWARLLKWATRSKKLVGAKGIATSNKDATRGSWPYY